MNQITPRDLLKALFGGICVAGLIYVIVLGVYLW